MKFQVKSMLLHIRWDSFKYWNAQRRRRIFLESCSD
ncbi:unnamed protein product [Larinioides sclopetarius]|uniref:Uncharacterized protein n=1 Tax=Larinioides sclopetarius TaxID=280406 RepID=A0AAV2ASB4_9ARAC